MAVSGNVLRAWFDWIATACGLAMTLNSRHCEEQRDEAIQSKISLANSPDLWPIDMARMEC